MLVPDGAYTFVHGQTRFHRAPAPSQFELERLLDILIGRITRTLVRTGVLVEDPEYLWLDIHSECEGDSVLEQLAGAAVRYRIAVGPIAGRKTMTLHSPGAVSGECAPAKTLTGARDGFSLNAAVVCEAHQRDKLERLCRYASRGPIALERLSIDGDGLVVHELKNPFRDGTTHVLFEPLDFIARLAALVPRPLGALPRVVRPQCETSSSYSDRSCVNVSAWPRTRWRGGNPRAHTRIPDELDATPAPGVRYRSVGLGRVLMSGNCPPACQPLLAAIQEPLWHINAR